MMDAARDEIRTMVYAYFAEECDVDLAEIRDETSIIEDLDGDSLMLLGLLKKATQRYGVTLPLKELGKYLMKKPADTIGDVVRLTNLLVEHGDNIVNIDV